MEFLQLKYFLEVAKTQHVTQTAHALHVSQPSLTQAIHRLERELGVKLFEPDGRGIRLTEAGDFFRRRVSFVLNDLNAAITELEQFKTQRAETVRIDVLSASSLVVDAIAAYKINHPHVRFAIGHTQPDPNSDIVVSMQQGGKTRGGDATCAQHFHERIMLAMPADDPALPAHGENVRLAELGERDFIMLAGSKSLTDFCVGHCAKLGLDVSTSFESDNPSMVRKMIGLGLGVGFWPERSWGSPEGDGARLVPIAEPGFTRTIDVARRDHADSHPEAASFYEFLVLQFEKRWEQ